MAGWSSLGTGLKTLILGGGGLVAAGVAGVIWQGSKAPVAQPVEIAAPVSAPVAPQPAAPPVAEQATAAPQAKVPAPAPPEASAAQPAPPSFDVVRVEPDGATLVAGRAEAGLDVAVLVDGAEVALSAANPQGRFVVFLTLAASSAPRVMTLELRPAAGPAVRSTDQVLLAPTPAPEAASDQVASAAVAGSDAPGLSATTPDPTGQATPLPGAEPSVGEGTTSLVDRVASADSTPAADLLPADVAVAPVAAAPEPESEPAASLPAPGRPILTEPAQPAVAAGPGAADAPPVAEPLPDPVATAAASQIATKTATAPVPPQAATALLLSGDRVRVLQSAQDGDAAASDTVSIDAISYTARGEVALSGKGVPKAFVRLYLDNRALLETGIGDDGTWGGTLPAVAPGVYVLRADQVSAAGQVTSRYETPFQREDPQALSAADSSPVAAAAPGMVNITVQPGFTLWQIARENYGDGMLYVRVYDANKTLIRDPDLIYPGQVFTVPQAD